MVDESPHEAPLKIEASSPDGTGLRVKMNGIRISDTCQAIDLNLTGQVGTRNSLWVELIGVVPHLEVDEMPLINMDLDRQKLEGLREIIDVKLQQMDDGGDDS